MLLKTALGIHMNVTHYGIYIVKQFAVCELILKLDCSYSNAIKSEVQHMTILFAVPHQDALLIT